MVGVAVQQAPWLCVLEYMEYGDLRSVLKAAEGKGLELQLTDQLNWSRQLAAGCGWISKIVVSAAPAPPGWPLTQSP